MNITAAPRLDLCVYDGVDIVFSPHALAVDTAVEVTEQLLAPNWKRGEDAKFGTGGRPEDDIKDLPVVRLRPPPGVGRPRHASGLHR